MFWTANADDEQLLRCWRLQSCGGCMEEEAHCSWCPFTQSCVPNNYLVPALAPAFNEGICPHWAERWEIRTHPLGCQVSTITSLTTIVTVLSTLTLILLVYFATWGFKTLRRLHVQNPDWWRVWEHEWPMWIIMPWTLYREKARGGEEASESAEEEPLLG